MMQKSVSDEEEEDSHFLDFFLRLDVLGLATFFGGALALFAAFFAAFSALFSALAARFLACARSTETCSGDVSTVLLMALRPLLLFSFGVT